MSHQCDTSTLRCTADKGNLDTLSNKAIGVLQGGIPCMGANGISVLLQRSKLDATASVDLDSVMISDLKLRLLIGAEVPAVQSSALRWKRLIEALIHDTFPSNSICFFICTYGSFVHITLRDRGETARAEDNGHDVQLKP